MKRVLIWGIGSFYEKILNLIVLEELKGNINVVAYITSEKLPFSKLDGRDIIRKDQISKYDFDYIIVASSFFNEIRKEASKLGILSNQLIKGEMFKYPRFDFKKYINLIEKKLTIITESCYGGYLYHSLGMQFYSPFINIRLFANDYLKLLNNLDYYLKRPLTMINDNVLMPIKKASTDEDYFEVLGAPVGILGDDIKLHMVHARSFKEAKTCWDRRIERMNHDNIIVFMIIDNDEIAERFNALPIKNKLGFYFKETNYDSIICINEWQNENVRFKYHYNFRRYMHIMLENGFSGWNPIDIIKVLNGERDFMRKYS